MLNEGDGGLAVPPPAEARLLNMGGGGLAGLLKAVRSGSPVGAPKPNEGADADAPINPCEADACSPVVMVGGPTCGWPNRVVGAAAASALTPKPPSVSTGMLPLFGQPEELNGCALGAARAAAPAPAVAVSLSKVTLPHRQLQPMSQPHRARQGPGG